MMSCLFQDLAGSLTFPLWLLVSLASWSGVQVYLSLAWGVPEECETSQVAMEQSAHHLSFITSRSQTPLPLVHFMDSPLGLSYTGELLCELWLA